MLRLKEYLKEHKYYFCVMLIFTFLFFLLMDQVVLYADDYLLKLKADTGGFHAIITEIKDVYLHWGGGPTPGIAIFFLLFNLGLWKVFNVFMISSSIHLTCNLLSHKNSNDKLRALLATVMWLLFFMIGLAVSRETLYWLDGSLAYILTTYLTFLYFYFSCQIATNSKKYHKCFLFFFFLLSFFAGWNGPQSGAISVLIGLFFNIYYYFKNKKWNYSLLISFFITTIGFGILYFAPGNSGRMSTFLEYNSLNLFGKIVYRTDDIAGLLVNFKYYPDECLPFYLFLYAILVVVYSISHKEEYSKITKFAISFMIIYLVGAFAYVIVTEEATLQNALAFIYDTTYHTSILINLIKYGLLVTFLLGILYLSLIVSYKEKNSLVSLFAFFALVSQAIMIFAPYSPYRSTYISIYFFMISIVSMISIMYRNNEFNKVVGAFLIAFGLYSFQYMIFACILYSISYFMFSKKNFVFLFLVFLLIPSMSKYVISLDYYNDNKNINIENEKRIEQFLMNGEDTLVLCRAEQKKEVYGFNFLYSDIEWIREDVKDYYHLPEDTIFRVIDCGL